MITAVPRSALGYWCRKVDEMKPGQRLEVSRHALRDIPTFEHNGADFTPPDRILGNIVGSAYTHSYRVKVEDGTVVFERHVETGERFYTDPDRRGVSTARLP